MSTLFVVFTISVLSYSPDDINFSSTVTEQKIDSSAPVVGNNSEIINNSDFNKRNNSSKNSSHSAASSIAVFDSSPQQHGNNSFGVNNVTSAPNPDVPNIDLRFIYGNNNSAANLNESYNENDDEDEILNTADDTSNISRKSIKNLCGPIGAVLSAVTVKFFGQSALLLLLPFGICAIKLLVNQKFDQVFLRTIGFFFALIGFCGLCGLFADKLILFPLATNNPGGIIGTVLATILNRNVAVVGSVVLLMSFIVSGSILFGDKMLLRLLNLLIKLLNSRSNDETASKLQSDSRSGSALNSVSNSLTSPSRSVEKSVSPVKQIVSVHSAVSERVSSRPVVKHCNVDSQSSGVSDNNKYVDNKAGDQVKGDQVKVAAAPKNISCDYKLPPVEILTQPEIYNNNDYIEESEHQAIKIEEVFKTFNLQVEVVDVQTGPTVSQFELQLAKGLRINKIQQLADDLGLALRTPKVRVVNPIPGKNTLGVELPNKHRRIVRIREVMEELSDSWKELSIPFFLGKDVSGKPMICDLATLTHLLIAGRTGTGKSVCLNSIIVSILMTRTPSEVRMIMIDPKSVELSPYQNIPHLIHPVIIDMNKTEAVLAWVVDKMQERYRLLNAARVVHINDYNKLLESELRERMGLAGCSEEEWQIVPKNLPRLVIIIDEFGELMSSVAPKEIECHIIRLAQKSRAVGIHLVLATQKPTVDVITGLIKSNLPARISFGVATRADSMVILDQTGAERLLGCGDMLFLNSDKNEIIRGQGTFVDRDDIDEIVNKIKTNTPDFIEELIENEDDDSEDDMSNNYRTGNGNNRIKRKEDNANFDSDQCDELYEKAVNYVIGEGRGSTSLLQRKLSIGYGRAAKIIEMMEADKIVGPYNGSQAREVIMSLNDWNKLSAKGGYQGGTRNLAAGNNNNFTALQNNSAQKNTSKVLSDILASGRTKTLPKPIKQSDIISSSSSGMNSSRHAIPISSENNIDNDYHDNNDYFDPAYEINENDQENYDAEIEFVS
ncbi:MAG: DNA translocase FtsK [Planctomycetaceae bacterium]|nr:DNA translocase FtsK [Planctomycetaceae bacterium]